MIILAIDSSASSGSVALLEDNQLIAEFTICVKRTHAEKLLPSIKILIDNTGIKKEDIDGFALTIGPGSFTGLRIGLATIKGFAWSLNKPVVGISTIEAMAMNIPFADKPVCPILDARKKELYAGIYKFRDASKSLATCLMADSAINPNDLLKKIDEPTIFLGEGLKVYGDFIKTALKEMAIIAPTHLWPIKASNVGLLAFDRFKSGNVEKPENINPNYLRQSEAEIKVKRA